MDTVWTHGQARQAETFDSVNPATSEVIATFPVHGRAEVERGRRAGPGRGGLVVRAGLEGAADEAARLEVPPDPLRRPPGRAHA